MGKVKVKKIVYIYKELYKYFLIFFKSKPTPTLSGTDKPERELRKTVKYFQYSPLLRGYSPKRSLRGMRGFVNFLK